MPPRRPSSHLNSDRSIIRLHESFLSKGWTVEDLDKDYGEDLLVRIFNDERATPYAFFVQAKATVQASRYLTRDGKYLRFPFKKDHFENWKDYWEPVVLTIWDAANDRTYWEIAQEPEMAWDERKSNFYCYFPLDNQLDEKGIRRIEARTKRRHQRYEQQQEGAEVLVALLEDELGVKIEYSPKNGVLIIEKPGEGGAQIVLFGKLGEHVRNTAAERGMNFDEYFHEVVKLGTNKLRENREAGKFRDEDEDGNEVIFNNSRALLRHVMRRHELEEDW
ncbi:DUF4365 domain-containing protein [Micromonospora sp. PTRAS2]